MLIMISGNLCDYIRMTKSTNYLSTSHSSTHLVFSKTSHMGAIVIISPFNIQKLRIRDINNLGYLIYYNLFINTPINRNQDCFHYGAI